MGAFIFNSGFPCVVPELSLFHKMISILDKKLSFDSVLLKIP